MARRARLGQKLTGVARIYDHVTPAMEQQILQALETRWRMSLQALNPAERARIAYLRSTGIAEPAQRAIAISSPSQQ